jgi:hypothetical protein
MEATDAEKVKARRVQLLLYGLIVAMIAAPLAILLLRFTR